MIIIDHSIILFLVSPLLLSSLYFSFFSSQYHFLFLINFSFICTSYSFYRDWNSSNKNTLSSGHNYHSPCSCARSCSCSCACNYSHHSYFYFFVILIMILIVIMVLIINIIDSMITTIIIIIIIIRISFPILVIYITLLFL